MAEPAPQADATLAVPGDDRLPAFDSGQRIEGFDDELAAAIRAEAERQELHLELIASENYASPRVLEAQGSVLTNKYAEGYSGHRYYGGCEFVDVAESLAVERARQLFSADYANVQPHSGSQANAAAYLALAKPGDTLLGMSLAEGGHLTHGSPVNFSGRIFRSVQYGLDPESGEIDYDQVETLAREHRPRIIVAGFSAYSRVVDWARFRTIADSTGAYFVADVAHVAGLIAAALPEPGPARGRDHDHHPQDPARAAGGPHPRPRQPRDREEALVDRVPRNAGRAPHARHRGEGGGAQGGHGAGLRRLSAGDRRQRPAHGDHHRGAQLPHRVRRHRQPPDAHRSPPARGPLRP